jgi:branched-chain amino acid transport system ATP-binding protein
MGAEDISFAKQLISNLSKQRRMTIVLIEHNMSLVMDISDRITVLQQGRKVAEGDPESIRKDPVVRAAYLGE